ncbi:hypothetical protein PYW07_014286 [Mythimna separata]|uniref:Uncharacterized protein n=1 Tax=Mythimna separata TaxID=271217 RepID=A0AAD8DYW2_MYTSE|nr:hypothetical protein PYW07_014286 [Mythimna separata]
MGSSVMSESCGGAVPQQQLCEYQASSPDEVALVKWTDMQQLCEYQASSPDEVALVKWTDMVSSVLMYRHGQLGDVRELRRRGAAAAAVRVPGLQS